MDKVNKAEDNEEKRWREEADVRTLIEAGEIMKDKPRHRAAIRRAKAQLKALSHVAS